jgi:hypothetical protein
MCRSRASGPVDADVLISRCVGHDCAYIVKTTDVWQRVAAQIVVWNAQIVPSFLYAICALWQSATATRRVE